MRDTKENREKMYKEFSDLRASQRMDKVEVSVDLQGSSEVTGALLTGDHDEELRMADRLEEKKTNAKEGKMKRITIGDIKESQRSPKNNEIVEERKDSLNEFNVKPKESAEGTEIKQSFTTMEILDKGGKPTPK